MKDKPDWYYNRDDRKMLEHPEEWPMRPFLPLIRDIKGVDGKEKREWAILVIANNPVNHLKIWNQQDTQDMENNPPSLAMFIPFSKPEDWHIITVDEVLDAGWLID